MPSEQITADRPVVYAVGDVHGRAGLLARLHAGIRDDARRYPGRRKCLVHLGDYVDRGPGSLEAVRLVRGGLAGFEHVALRGNHEQMMVDAVRSGDRMAFSNWLLNGGRAVLEELGVDPSEKPASAREALSRAAAGELAWMEGLPYFHSEYPFLFVHAGIVPGRALEMQRHTDLIWIRDAFLNDRRDHGVMVVHGHTPTPDGLPDVRNNRIGLDTGAAYGGPLTAAVLDCARPDEVRFLQAHPR